MQTAIVIIIVALAASYVSWLIYQAFVKSNDPCAGCQGCAMKEIKRKNGENRGCKEKK